MTLSGWLKLDELARTFPVFPGVEGHRPSNFLPHVRMLQTHTHTYQRTHTLPADAVQEINDVLKTQLETAGTAVGSGGG